MMARNRCGLFECVLIGLAFVQAPVWAGGAAVPKPSPSPLVSGVPNVPVAVPVEGGELKVSLSANDVPDGALVRVTVESLQDPQVLGEVKAFAEFETTQIPFYYDKKRNVIEGLFGIPYGQKPGQVPLILRLKHQGKDIVQSLPVFVHDGGYPSEQLTVDPSKVHPSKKALARIQKERVEIGKVYSHLTEEKYWSGPFQFPMPSPITSRFGTKRVFNGDFNSFHTGLDFKATIGSKVFAAAAGKVVWTKNLFYTGNTVMIDHGFGVITIYAHLSKIKVRNGQIVQPGQWIALSGKTGRVSGPHLHWQAVVHKTKINPMDLTWVMQ